MAATRQRFSPDEIRAGLIKENLTEEEKPIPGFAFGFGKHPTAAVAFWKEQHGGAEARRFYIDRRSFILSE